MQVLDFSYISEKIEMLWFKMNLYSKFDDLIPEQMFTTTLLLNIRINPLNMSML